MREAFLGTLDYEVDTLHLLAAYRAMFLLRQAQWHDTGSSGRVRRLVAPRASDFRAARGRAPATATRATSTTRPTT